MFLVAATGVLLADYLATYESEFAYIWKYVEFYSMVLTCILKQRRRPMTSVKIIFLLARYIAIFGQAYVVFFSVRDTVLKEVTLHMRIRINCYLILMVISPDRIPIDEKICWIAVSYQAVVAISLHLLSESILIRRGMWVSTLEDNIIYSPSADVDQLPDCITITDW